jgi:hypothetical protein
MHIERLLLVCKVLVFSWSASSVQLSECMQTEYPSAAGCSSFPAPT